MAERVHVWVQRFKDRPTLMLQWIDPETGTRKSKSGKTSPTAQCKDGSTSYAENHSGACSGHGGVQKWTDGSR